MSRARRARRARRRPRTARRRARRSARRRARRRAASAVGGRRAAAPEPGPRPPSQGPARPEPSAPGWWSCVVVGVVSGPSTAIVIVTVEPFGAFVPGPGLWLQDLAHLGGFARLAGDDLGLEARLFERGRGERLALADDVRHGGFLGRLRDDQVDLALALTELPLAGDCERTVSGACVELGALRDRAERTARRSRASLRPPTSDSPVTSGHLDRRRVRSRRAPARGCRAARSSRRAGSCRSPGRPRRSRSLPSSRAA